MHFISFLQEFGLFVPSTFQLYSSGDCRHTFVARGHRAVDDYILVSSGVDIKPRSARVLVDFDNGRESDDHLPVVCTMSLMAPSSVGINKRRKAQYDRSAVSDPDRAPDFLLNLNAYQPVPFDLEPSSHACVLNDYVSKTLRNIYPIRNTSKRKPYIDEETFQLILEKGRLMKKSRTLRNSLKWACVRFCFIVWHSSESYSLSTFRWQCASGPIDLKLVRERCHVQRTIRNLSTEIKIVLHPSMLPFSMTMLSS